MAQSKFTLYIKLANGSWRYCKSALYSNGKISPTAASLSREVVSVSDAHLGADCVPVRDSSPELHNAGCGGVSANCLYGLPPAAGLQLPHNSM